MKLRVYWILRTLKKVKDVRLQYEKEQKSTDFPADKDPQEAVAEIYKEHGRVTDGKNGMTPKKYAQVNSWATVSESAPESLPCFSATEMQLFDGLEMKKCLGTKEDLQK